MQNYTHHSKILKNEFACILLIFNNENSFADCKIEFIIDRKNYHKHSILVTNLMHDSEQGNTKEILIPLSNNLEFTKFFC